MRLSLDHFLAPLAIDPSLREIVVAFSEIARSVREILQRPRSESALFVRGLSESMNERFLACESIGGLLSGQSSIPVEGSADGKWLVAYEPLSGVEFLPINGDVGSVFSVLPRPHGPVTTESFFQPGSGQAAAAYVLYGPATVLVLSVDTAVHGFTFDSVVGEFLLSHPTITVSGRTLDYTVGGCDERIWDVAIKRYIRECRAGAVGERARDYRERASSCLIFDLHRTLLRGGVCLYPLECPERINLLTTANPVSLLVERAGGFSSAGAHRLLSILPQRMEATTPLYFGAREEIEYLEKLYTELGENHAYDSPLFRNRSLFAP